LPSERSLPPFKGNSPYVRPQTPRAESSPTRSKALPCDSGAGSRMSCKPAQGRRSQTAARGAHDRPAVTSDPPLLPGPTGGRGGQPCRRHATAPGGHASPTSGTPAWKSRPTRQATGAPVAACKQPHRHLCHRRAPSVAEPMPRLEATQQRQPGASVKATESGPAIMAVAGGWAQQSRRQPGSRLIPGQQESLLSRREDGAPVTRSSNGSRTRNGRPANYPPRRINSAAGHAAPLAGEARNASPSP
jgi:Tfp pilus assembly protein FimV